LNGHYVGSVRPDITKNMIKKNLDFVKSVGESMANEYSINWESWTEEETKRIEKEANISMKFYEKLFREFNIDNEEHTVEMFEDILENLVSGYVLLSIINRKKAVDELLSSV
jgi:hypothetical protein